MDIASLVNAILADDGYNALSVDTKNKFEQYLDSRGSVKNEVGTNTCSGEQLNLFEPFNLNATVF